MRRLKNKQLKEALRYIEDMENNDGIKQMSFPDAGLCRVREALEEKRARRRIGFTAFLKRQVHFIGWKIWLLQGGFLLLLYCLFMHSVSDFSVGNIRYTAYFLCCLSVLVILSAAPAFYRCVRYAMYEIELVSRFSIIKLLLAKILVIGIGDIVLLAALLWITVFSTNMLAGSALLYILLPGLVSGAGFLYLLGHVPAERLQTGSIGLGGILFFIFFLLKEFCPLFFIQTFSVGWAAVCLTLLFICGWQFHYLLHDSAYAKVQIL